MFKKLLALTLACLMMIPCVVALAGAETLTCGEYEYTLNDDGSVTITDYHDRAETLTIPAELDGHSVSAIGVDAFFGCDSLTSVTIPDSVTSIGDYAFSCCTALSDISIPDSVISIGDEAFYMCESLASITLPDSVTSIGINPFTACIQLSAIIVSPYNSSLKVIDGVLFDKTSKTLICYPCGLEEPSYIMPEGIQAIGSLAFYACESLVSISIPDSVTSIGNNPFACCTQLTQFTVSPDHPTLETINGVLFDKSTRTLICYPCAFTEESYAVPEGIQAIGKSAFGDCTFLINVTLPDGVITIDESAFYNCFSLTSITIPDSVASIGNYAFFNCNSLSDISIPESITSIGDQAFWGCSSLTCISIPDSVTSIGNQAFYHCPNLTLTVPQNSYAEAYAMENGIPYTY